MHVQWSYGDDVTSLMYLLHTCAGYHGYDVSMLL